MPSILIFFNRSSFSVSCLQQSLLSSFWSLTLHRRLPVKPFTTLSINVLTILCSLCGFQGVWRSTFPSPCHGWPSRQVFRYLHIATVAARLCDNNTAVWSIRRCVCILSLFPIASTYPSIKRKHVCPSHRSNICARKFDFFRSTTQLNLY